MGRIEIPEFNKPKSTAPNWIDADALKEASSQEAKEREEVLSKISSQSEDLVISYIAPSTGKIYFAGEPRLVVQARMAKSSNQPVEFTDPDTGEKLHPYRVSKKINHIGSLKYSNETEVMPQVEKTSGVYTNTFVDRHVVYKTLDALQRYASQKGLSLARARYIKGEYGQRKLGSELITIAKVSAELEWSYGRNQKGRIFANAEIDPAGKIQMPTTFKIASGEEFEFNEDNIRQLEKNSTFREVINIKPKKSDVPQIRRPDISNFMATASLKTGAPVPGNTMPQNTTNPSQPYAPGSQYINPADNKTYTVKAYDPQKGATVTSPEGQDMLVPQDQVQNLKPVMKTSAYDFSVEAMADDLLRKLTKKDKEEEKDEKKEKKEDKDDDDDDMVEKLTKKDKKKDKDEKKEEKDEKEEKESSLKKKDSAVLETKSSRVANMGKRWLEIRNEIREKQASQRTVTSKHTFQDEVVEELAKKGYKALKSLEVKPNETGRDPKTHIPTKSSGNVEIGMTDFPDFTKPIQEAQADILKDREHFTNEDKLPVYNMRRNELKKYMDDEKGGEKNYGLSEEARGDKDFKNPDPFRKKSSTDEDLANALISKTALEKRSIVTKENWEGKNYSPEIFKPGTRWSLRYEGMDEEVHDWEVTIDHVAPDNQTVYTSYTVIDGEIIPEDPTDPMYFLIEDVVEATPLTSMASRKTAESTIPPTEGGEEEKIDVRPIQYKPQKKAPGLEEFKEPEVIPEAEGKVKEAITKFRKVQADIEEVKKQLQEKIAPIQKKLMDVQKPFQEDLVKKQESFSSYLEMIYTQLSETEDKISAYGDKIMAVVERGKQETKAPTMAQLLKRLAEVEPAVSEVVLKVKEAMENEHVSNVLERYLYEYPVSKEHEKKKVVRTADEEGSFKEALKVLKVALMGLLNLNETLQSEEV